MLSPKSTGWGVADKGGRGAGERHDDGCSPDNGALSGCRWEAGGCAAQITALHACSPHQLAAVLQVLLVLKVQKNPVKHCEEFIGQRAERMGFFMTAMIINETLWSLLKPWSRISDLLLIVLSLASSTQKL